MLLNPLPGGEEPTLQLPLRVPPAEPQKVAPQGLDSGGDDTLEEASPSTLENANVQPAQAKDGFVLEPTVPRIEALPGEVSKAPVDKRSDVLSLMPKAPVLDLGIELAIRVAPSAVAANASGDVPSDVASQEPSEVASQEMTVKPGVVQDIASADLKPSTEVQTQTAEPHSPSAIAQTPAREPQRAGPGIQPLASALDAAVRLATDASVAAEALEKLKVLLQHKQQLEGLRAAQPVEHKQSFHALRSAQPALARPSRGEEASASEPHPIALPVLPPPLPPLPLPVRAPEASTGRLALLQPRRRALLELRALDVRGFMAGFALSGAFGVVLYFFMTAG